MRLGNAWLLFYVLGLVLGGIVFMAFDHGGGTYHWEPRVAIWVGILAFASYEAAHRGAKYLIAPIVIGGTAGLLSLLALAIIAIANSGMA